MSGAENAVKEYRTVIKIKSDYTEAHANLGIALWNLDKDHEANEELKEAVRLDSNCAEAHLNLGDN
jgi:Flp pilus assembly protein TadD